MVVLIRHIDVWSALRFGLVFSPILYTATTFIYTQGGAGVTLGGYLSTVAQAIVYGAATAAVSAFTYNIVARRFGSVKLHLEVVHESQDSV